MLTPLAYVRPGILSSSFSDIRDCSRSGHGRPIWVATWSMQPSLLRVTRDARIPQTISGRMYWDMTYLLSSQGGYDSGQPPAISQHACEGPYNIGGLADTRVPDRLRPGLFQPRIVRAPDLSRSRLRRGPSPGSARLKPGATSAFGRRPEVGQSEPHLECGAKPLHPNFTCLS